MFKGFKLSAGWTIIIFILLAIITPILLTRNGLTWLNFTETGPIGDTIGGLTAPIIGLLNAVLLYITLKRQDEQIKEQRIEIDIDRKSDSIRSQIKDLKFTVIVTDLVNGKQSISEAMVGRRTISLAIAIFTSNYRGRIKYNIEIVEWSEFCEQITNILVDASWILSNNLNSTKSLSEKISIFRYTKILISKIDILIQDLNKCKEENPEDFNDGELGSYIEDIASFNIDKYDPENRGK